MPAISFETEAMRSPPMSGRTQSRPKRRADPTGTDHRVHLLDGGHPLDQRKDYEEAEANAVGTEYVRAELLPPDDAANVRKLLSRYVDQRVLFYVTRDQARIRQIDADTAK